MPPAGMSTALFLMVSAISPRVNPKDRKVFWETSILSSGCRMPRNSTWVISGRSINSSRIVSAMSKRDHSSISPYKASRTTSLLLVFRLIRGLSASSGSEEIRSMPFLISWRDLLGFTPDRSSTVIWARPSLATAVTLSTSSRDLISSSIARMIPSSTSSGLAPGYWTETSTISRSYSGKTSWVIMEAAIRPPMTRISISRFAATWFPAIQASMFFWTGLLCIIRSSLRSVSCVAFCFYKNISSVNADNHPRQR